MSYRVWLRFEVKRGDEILKLRIQDMPAERFEDVVNFYVEYLSKHESMFLAAGADKNPAAIEEARGFTREMLKKDCHIAICCLDDSPTVGDILGISAMCITKKDEKFNFEELQLQTAEYKKFFAIIQCHLGPFDLAKKLGLERYYDGRGLAVHPDYRGLGIGTEFCRSRMLICKDQGIPVTSAIMTAPGSQKAAEKAGWETILQVPVSTIEEQVGCKFRNGPEFLKTMMVRVDL